MKIDTKKLSKESLVELVDVCRDAGVINNSAILAFYRADLNKQFCSIMKRIDDIDKQLNDQRISMKRYDQLVEQKSRLWAASEKKITMLEKSIESGESDHADCQINFK